MRNQIINHFFLSLLLKPSVKIWLRGFRYMKISFSCFFIFSIVLCSESQSLEKNREYSQLISIPLGGNAWVIEPATITNEGLSNWTSENQICEVYLRVEEPGNYKFYLNGRVLDGESVLAIDLLGKTSTIKLSSAQPYNYYVGEWLIKEPGYVKVVIKPISKTSTTYGDISSILISSSSNPKLSFVEDNNDNYFYWGRRGPSVHLNYQTTGINDIEWFYSELTVPTNNDVIGSYFMANGFSDGYFGIQVNSETERRILFSVWSPFVTDDPSKVPDDKKILLAKKGVNTYVGEFGNEGSGGQSYVVYPWKTGVTYRFLLQGKPIEGNYTQYTAYFFSPEENQWMLIASFKRPYTNSYLTRLHAFLENFEPHTGNKTRMALYSNQWIMDQSGVWKEIRETQFSADNTARKNFRKDYSAGEINGAFYLKNCGFFNDNTPIGLKLVRPAMTAPPQIDFKLFKE